MFHHIKNFHFIGIGGIGMSGLAEILLNLGYLVSGSDIKESSSLERLREKGALIKIGHHRENIGHTQVVVVSSAISQNNPEIREALEKNIPMIHRSEMLAELMRQKMGIVISGTHGKTTTTSMIACALTGAKLDPTVVVGGKVHAMKSNAQLGTGKYFVAEGDESDGTFLKLHATIAIITNVDKDHMDFYGLYENIQKAFIQFANQVPFYGCVCLALDDPGVQWILPQIKKPYITYGFHENAHIKAKNVKIHGLEQEFQVEILGTEGPLVKLKMIGKHNIQNALASFAVGHFLGIDPQQTAQSLNTFEGVEHRGTLVGTFKNGMIFEDYAHNPQKIESALKALRENFPESHITAIFQPHRYTRVHALFEEFSKAFWPADTVLVTPVYTAGEQPIEGEDVHIKLATNIKLKSFPTFKKEVFPLQNKEAAIDLLLERKDIKNHIIITLGAGDIEQIAYLLDKKFKE